MSTTIDQQFIEYIVKSLVGNPDAVEIKRTIDEKGVLLELTVDPQDLGRVIGKRGSGAQALRTLLRALGTKNDARYNLKIVDNGEPHERRHDDRRDEQRQDDNESNAQSTSSDEEAAPAAKPVPVASSSLADLKDEDDDEETAEDSSSVVDKTRKELADLDDLDI